MRGLQRRGACTAGARSSGPARAPGCSSSHPCSRTLCTRWSRRRRHCDPRPQLPGCVRDQGHQHTRLGTRLPDASRGLDIQGPAWHIRARLWTARPTRVPPPPPPGLRPCRRLPTQGRPPWTQGRMAGDLLALMPGPELPGWVAGARPLGCSHGLSCSSTWGLSETQPSSGHPTPRLGTAQGRLAGSQVQEVDVASSLSREWEAAPSPWTPAATGLSPASPPC